MDDDMSLSTNVSLANELVLSVRKTSNEFIVKEIRENVEQRIVQAEIELGPFTTDSVTGIRPVTRGLTRRGITVWEGADYDAVELTWNNTDLINRIKELLEAEATATAALLNESN